MEWETFSKIYQKDVNNYIVVHDDGKYKSKGAYVKKLDILDYDLPIVNTALINYFTSGTPIADTINLHTNLMEFQKVVKITGKYKNIIYNGENIQEKCIRVFASKSVSDGPVYKINSDNKPEKIANTPERCYIENENIIDAKVPRKLDKRWYINMAEKRLDDFGISNQIKMW